MIFEKWPLNTDGLFNSGLVAEALVTSKTICA